MTAGKQSLFESFQLAAEIVQTQKHAAMVTTAQCAANGDYDLEAHYRSKAEGLAEAEKLLRGHAEEMRTAE